MSLPTYEDASKKFLEKVNKTNLFHNALEDQQEKKLKETVMKSDIRLLFKAVSSGEEDIVREFLQIIDVNEKDSFGGSLLHHAASENNINIVKILLDNKADVNTTDQSGWTPLHTSCVNANLDVCNLLLEYNADGNIKNNGGNIPLHYFVRNSSDIIIKDPSYYSCLSNLVQNSSKTATNNQGESPLHLAALRGTEESIRLYMVASKSDLNCTNSTGETPLIYAVRLGRMRIVKSLLKLSANIEISGKQGNALQVAVKENQHEILDVLNETLLENQQVNNAPNVLLTQDTEYKRDRYGFPLEEEQIELFQQYDSNFTVINESRKKAWSKFLSQRDLSQKVNNSSVKLQNLLKKGIPKEHRGDIWFRIVTAKIGNPPEGYYERLLTKKVYPFSGDIDKDVPRTFPIHSFFSSESTRASLRRVLLAYSIRNPSVGYCQSMNFIVGILLLNVSEKRAFWILKYIVEDLMDDYFIQSMIGLSIDQKVLESIVQDEAPKIYNHLEKLSFPLSIFTTRWFMCAFLNTLPTEAVMRIWDIFLYEGARILITVSYSLLKSNEKGLLGTKNTHQLMVFIDSITSSVFNVDELIEESIKNYNLLSDIDLQERRLRYWNIVNKERKLKALQVMFMQQDRSYFTNLPIEEEVPEDEIII